MFVTTFYTNIITAKIYILSNGWRNLIKFVIVLPETLYYSGYTLYADNTSERK